MKKVILAAVVAVALCAIPATVEAAPPGFYAGGYYTTPFPLYPSTQGFSYYSSPYGYQTYSTFGVGLTPWGWSMYNYGGTSVRPYVNAPYHSVYWDPFNNTYQYSTGYLNTPTWSYGYRYGYRPRR
jgi:hypothetical protein